MPESHEIDVAHVAKLARLNLTAEEALSNAPRQANDLFVVPKVVE